MYTNLIQADELQQLADSTVILDCRARLGQPGAGQELYLAGHLPGARFADLDRDLAAMPGAGGRHPLPEQADWLTTIRQWGIGNDTQVVVYDDAGGAYAARAWWMLRWVGHAAVAVLDGGLQSWNGPLASGEEPAATPSDFQARPSLTRLITVAEMEAAVAENRYTLLDARAEARWAGREEPVDPVAGHIPGALCRAFQDNLGPDGRFKSPRALAERFPADDADVVCYCGSGVTAGHNILAMHIAGLPEPWLYAGSWSGWITDPDAPGGQRRLRSPRPCPNRPSIRSPRPD